MTDKPNSANPNENPPNHDLRLARLLLDRFLSFPLAEMPTVARQIAIHVPKESAGEEIAGTARCIEGTIGACLEFIALAGVNSTRLEETLRTSSIAQFAFELKAWPFPESIQADADATADNILVYVASLAELVRAIRKHGDWHKA